MSHSHSTHVVITESVICIRYWKTGAHSDGEQTGARRPVATQVTVVAQGVELKLEQFRAPHRYSARHKSKQISIVLEQLPSRIISALCLFRSPRSLTLSASLKCSSPIRSAHRAGFSTAAKFSSAIPTSTCHTWRYLYANTREFPHPVGPSSSFSESNIAHTATTCLQHARCLPSLLRLPLKHQP